jgi:hypothetical protein
MGCLDYLMFWLSHKMTPLIFWVFVFLRRKFKESFLGLIRYYVKMAFTDKKAVKYFKIIINDKKEIAHCLFLQKLKSSNK